MLARSHVALTVCPYLVLLSNPLPFQVDVPVLGLPAGEAAADPVVTVALSAGIAALAALAPDLDHAGSALVPGRPTQAGPAPRELEVVALVARGLTNRQIATALVITERTAATHDEHILAKLGLTSRVQIGVWAADHGLGS